MECFITISICRWCSHLEAAPHPGLHTRRAALLAPALTASIPRITEHWALGAAVCSYLLPHGYGQAILVLVQEEVGSVTAPGRPMEGAHPLTEVWGIVAAGGASVPALWLLTH